MAIEIRGNAGRYIIYGTMGNWEPAKGSTCAWIKTPSAWTGMADFGPIWQKYHATNNATTFGFYVKGAETGANLGFIS